MTDDNALPNLADGLAAASEVAHVAEHLHDHLARAGREYDLGLPSSFNLQWDDTPVPHQLTLVHAAGHVIAHVVEHLATDRASDPGGSLTVEQLQRVAALSVAGQALPVTRGVLGSTTSPRHLDLLVVAHWLVVGGDPLAPSEGEADEDEDDDEGVEVQLAEGTTWHLRPARESEAGTDGSSASPSVFDEVDLRDHDG